MRTFIALELSPALKEQLAGITQLLHGHKFVKPVPIDNMHMTLVFLGETEDNKARTIAGYLEEKEQGAGTEFFIRGVDCFPNGRRPRVLVLALDDPSGILARIYRELSVYLKTGGLSFDDRKEFKPHLTLARFKTPDPGIPELVSKVKKRAGDLLGKGIGVFLSGRPVLFESILQQGKPPLYKKVGSQKS